MTSMTVQDLLGFNPDTELAGKIVIVVVNNGILNLELNRNHETCCGVKSSSIIHFGKRFCVVDVHKGVDQVDISKCKHCKKFLTKAEQVSIPMQESLPIEGNDQSSVGTSDTESIKDLQRKRRIGPKSRCGRKKNFQCDVCEKYFMSEYLLQNHFLCIHLKEKNFKCDYCDKTFCAYYSLRRHVKSHLDDINMIEVLEDEADEKIILTPHS